MFSITFKCHRISRPNTQEKVIQMIKRGNRENSEMIFLISQWKCVSPSRNSIVALALRNLTKVKRGLSINTQTHSIITHQHISHTVQSIIFLFFRRTKQNMASSPAAVICGPARHRGNQINRNWINFIRQRWLITVLVVLILHVL